MSSFHLFPTKLNISDHNRAWKTCFFYLHNILWRNSDSTEQIILYTIIINFLWSLSSNKKYFYNIWSFTNIYCLRFLEFHTIWDKFAHSRKSIILLHAPSQLLKSLRTKTTRETGRAMVDITWARIGMSDEGSICNPTWTLCLEISLLLVTVSYKWMLSKLP